MVVMMTFSKCLCDLILKHTESPPLGVPLHRLWLSAFSDDWLPDIHPLNSHTLHYLPPTPHSLLLVYIRINIYLYLRLTFPQNATRANMRNRFPGTNTAHPCPFSGAHYFINSHVYPFMLKDILWPFHNF